MSLDIYCFCSHVNSLYSLVQCEASGTYHRGVEAGDLGFVDFTAAILWFFTGRDESDDPLRIGGCFHIRQAFSPST